MKKRLKFLLSVLLVAVIALGAFTMPAASFEHDVPTTTSSMLLVNLDTDTVCFSAEPDRKRYASYMSELMTFIVASELSKTPEEQQVSVTREFIDELPDSDGSLEKFVGKTLTMRDLMTIMMLSSGSDAAYLIADTLGGVEGFVERMNRKAAQIGCDRTHFETPGRSESKEHYTTCRDIYRMMMRVGTIELYREIMESPEYLPPGLLTGQETESQLEKLQAKYTVTTENSLINPISPYYFRYTTGGKYSYDETALANFAVTTTYQNKNYMFVGMHGLNKSEQNIYTDGRKLIIWAYQNLSDRRVIDSDKTVSTYRVAASWGEYEVGLVAGNSDYKTLPMEFEEAKLTTEISIPELTTLPVFTGQSIGAAKIFYDGAHIENVNLVSSTDEGASLLNDVSRFGLFAFSEILSNDPEHSEPEPADQPSDATEAPEEVKP